MSGYTPHYSIGEPTQKSLPSTMEERYYALKEENVYLKSQIQKLTDSLLETITKLDSLSRKFDTLTYDLNKDIPRIWQEIDSSHVEAKFGPYTVKEIVEKYPELGHVDFSTKNQDFKTNMCTRSINSCGFIQWKDGDVIRDDCMFAHSYEQLGFFTEGKKWRARNGQKLKKRKWY